MDYDYESDENDNNDKNAKNTTQKDDKIKSKENLWTLDDDDEQNNQKKKTGKQLDITFDDHSENEQEIQQQQQQQQQQKQKPQQKQAVENKTNNSNKVANKSLSQAQPQTQTPAKPSSKTDNMPTSQERFAADNNKLFGDDKKPATSTANNVPAKSQNCTLQSFPLESLQDCKNFASQITQIIKTKRYDEDISSQNVVSFVQCILTELMEDFDLVDASAIQQHINVLTEKKQKQMAATNKKKNSKLPQLGKQQKPQNVNENNNKKKVETKKTEPKNDKNAKEFKEGQYDSDEFNAYA